MRISQIKCVLMIAGRDIKAGYKGDINKLISGIVENEPIVGASDEIIYDYLHSKGELQDQYINIALNYEKVETQYNIDIF